MDELSSVSCKRQLPFERKGRSPFYLPNYIKFVYFTLLTIKPDNLTPELAKINKLDSSISKMGFFQKKNLIVHEEAEEIRGVLTASYAFPAVFLTLLSFGRAHVVV